MENYDVIVVGAGIVGLSTAYRAQKAGARVLVLDRGAVGAESSSRATGYLALCADEPAEADLAALAEKIWPTLDEELGYATEWTQKGRLWCAFNDRQEAGVRRLYDSFTPNTDTFEWIDAQTCREILPILSPKVVSGFHTQRSGHANPQRAVQAFAWAFQDLGGTIQEYSPVLEILTDSGKVKGVRIPGGEIHASRVVVCAASVTPKLLEPLGIYCPIAAVRVEAMVTTPLPPMYQVAFIGNGVSIRQTKRGNLHANGGPHEWVDVDGEQEPAKPNTPNVRNLARRVTECFPVAAGAQMLRCWAGVVEATPDHMSIVEKSEAVEGLIIGVAAGHGFGMAPSMGIALAELALDGATSAPVAPLSLARFKEPDPDWRTRRNWAVGSYNT